MSRVDELQGKYPLIPREVIVNWDVLGRGVRDSEVLDKIGRWVPGIVVYNADHDVSLQEQRQKRPERIKHGYVMNPVSRP